MFFMPILYAPPHWEPRSIPDSSVTQCLKQGYRRECPTRPPEQKAMEVQPLIVPPVITDPALVPVNTASLKDLTGLPNVTTAIAKKVIAQRPYTSASDLLERLPEIDWIALESRLSFSDAVNG